MPTYHGFSDNPITEDFLGMDVRCRGITEFIRKCSTPMTVAIQGDWGTGKSTVMNLIEKMIREDEGDSTCLIQFNTWQFSALNSEDKLIVDLLNVMLRRFREWADAHSLEDNAEINSQIEESSKFLNGLRFFTEFSMRLGKEILEDSIFGKSASALDQTVEAHNRKPDAPTALLPDDELISKVDIVTGMKACIEKLIGEITAHQSAGNRVYVFIDDLDRLEPRIAVELMEGLKNFADFKNCVFLLAVDQEVVVRGLKSKYGQDLEDEKARNFFDKIIQVPFQLPVSAYRITEYVRQFVSAAADNPEDYVRLLDAFQERNPRTIKRSFNVLQLNECIRLAAPHAEALSKTERLRLYAVQLLQLKSPAAFRDLLLTVEQHRTEVFEGDCKNFIESLRRLFRDPEDETLRIPLTQYLPVAVEVFFDPYQPGIERTAANEIREFVSCVMQTREASAIDDTQLMVSRQLRSLRRLRQRLLAEDDLDLSPEWSVLDGSADLLFPENGKSLQLTVYCGDDKYLMLSWHNRAQCLNMTVYHFDDPAQIFQGVEPYFVRKEDPDSALAAYRYYLASGPSRLTVAGFSDYQDGDPLEQLLINCGVLHQRDD